MSEALHSPSLPGGMPTTQQATTVPTVVGSDMDTLPDPRKAGATPP
jgi:hypothetical protein